VYLSLLDIEVLLHGGLTDDGGDREDTLAAYTTKYNICFHLFPFLGTD
jgi:hypothetical protein